MIAAPRLVTIIQARLGSTRFPHKVLADFNGKTMLEACVREAEKLGWPICVACPKSDRELLRYVWEKGWTWYAGSETDVLDRYYEAAQMMKADWVCRMTSDCPLGQIYQIIPMWALEMAWREAREPHEREHVDPWLKRLSVDTIEDLERVSALQK